MNGLLLLTALMTPGQGAGVGEDLWMWKQNERGIEYIVQIEPTVVDEMRTGKEVYSNVPEQMQVVNINRVRFRHGTGKFTEADVASTVGLQNVQYGYQPLTTGGMEFLVQIPPTAVDAFKAGTDVIIDIPAAVRSIKRFVILIGTQTLPRLPGNSQPVNNLEPPPVTTTPPAPIIDPSRPVQPMPTQPITPPNLTPPGNVTNPNTNPNYNPNTNPNYNPNTNPSYNPNYNPNTTNPNYNPNYNPNTTNPNYNPNPNAPTGQPAINPYTGLPYNQPPNYQQPYGQPPNYQPQPAPVLPPRGTTGPTIPVTTPASVTDPNPTPPTTTLPTRTVANTQLPAETKSKEPAPILPNALTILALFASLGANLFLGWVAMGLYDRYRRALTDMRDQSRRVARA